MLQNGGVDSNATVRGGQTRFDSTALSPQAETRQRDRSIRRRHIFDQGTRSVGGGACSISGKPIPGGGSTARNDRFL
jgi:hypothetical protein